jgi:hypothetical protein
MGQTVRIRPSDTRDMNFEDSVTTKNVSKNGIYFVTERREYSAGMRVRVTLIVNPLVEQLNPQHVGQVTRVETLPDGKSGVAVQLLTQVPVGAR